MAVDVINFLVNDPEAGKILGTDRGLPSNLDVRKAVADTVTDAEHEDHDRVRERAGHQVRPGAVGAAEGPRHGPRPSCARRPRRSSTAGPTPAEARRRRSSPPPTPHGIALAG